MKQKQILSFATASIVVALSAHLYAASATWTGADSASPTTFSDGLNWSTGTVPGAYSDVGTFSAANNGTTIVLPATLGTFTPATGVVPTSGPGIGFDGTAVAYTIGTAANGSTLYIGSSGYNITAAAGAASQTLNPTLILGNRGSAGFSIGNNSPGTTDTYNGNITSLSNGTNTAWTVSVSGANGSFGSKILNGVISDAGIAGDGLILAVGRGQTTVNGVNTYIGGTTITGGSASTLVVGNKSALGTGAVSINTSGATFSAGADLTGANALANNFVSTLANQTANFTGANNVQINGTFDLNASATTNSTTVLAIAAPQTTTLSGVVANGGASTVLSKTGTGVLILANAANTYAGNTYVSGGTLLLNGNTGTSGYVLATNAGTVLGGSGTTAGIVEVATGASFRPGASVGNSTAVFTTSSTGNSAFKLDAGSTSVFDINGTARGTQYDGVTTPGKVTYGGDLTINLNTISGGTNVYDLFNFASQGGVPFNTITIAGADAGTLTATGGGNFSGTFNGGQDTISFAQLTGDLTVNAVVPEPATLGVIGAAATLLVRRRRAAK